jgi:hypothetical protein
MQEAYAIWLRERNARGYLLTELGCPPLIGYERLGYPAPCQSSSAAAIALIEARHIKDVVLVSGWINWFNNHTDFVDHLSVVRSTTESQAALGRSFDRTMQELARLGVRVWIMEPLPQARYDVPSTLAKAIYLGNALDAAYTRAQYYDLAEHLMAALERNGAYIYRRIPIGRIMCQSGTCLIVNDGVPIYADNNHIAFSRSAFFANLLDQAEAPPLR